MVPSSGSLSSDSSGELHVLWHDGNSLGVDGAQVGVLEKTNHVGLGGFLEGKDGRGLESEVRLEVRSDLSNESLERKLSNEELSGFLESSDFSEGDGSWSESVWFLHTSGSGGGGSLLGLGSDVLSWSLSSLLLSSGLLGSGHFIVLILNYYIPIQPTLYTKCLILS
jgi:histone H3